MGLYGKLPARGDFVRVGLPRSFADRWDGWLALAIAGSQAQMGEVWLPAFLEAPVWCFLLPPGLCGTQAALGLMLPSVDRAGRYFPLTFAALFPGGACIADAPAWLERCEAAGRAALEQDAGPDDLAAILGVPDVTTGGVQPACGQSLWWTDGAPRVPAKRFSLSGLPDAAVYATMLDAATALPAADGAMMQEMTRQEADMPAKAGPAGEKSWEPAP